MTPDQLATAGLRYDVDGSVATITLDRPVHRVSESGCCDLVESHGVIIADTLAG